MEYVIPNTAKGLVALTAIWTIVLYIIAVVLLILCIITFIRFCKVLGRVQDFFDEFRDNGLSFSQVMYSNAVNLKKIAEYTDDIAKETEGLKVVTEAIGREDMSVYDDYQEECD